MCENSEMVIKGFKSAVIAEAVNDAGKIVEKVENPFGEL